MPDIDRHRADPMSRTSYQRDDLERKKAAETVRLENRRVHSQQMLKRINDREQTAAEKYESKLNTKAASSMIYQHVAMI
jgi:hypothetical protein